MRLARLTIHPELRREVRLRVAGRTGPTALSLVSATVLTLHPADEQPDSFIGSSQDARWICTNGVPIWLAYRKRGIGMTRRGRDCILTSLRRPRPTVMVGFSFGYTKSWEYLRTGYGLPARAVVTCWLPFGVQCSDWMCWLDTRLCRMSMGGKRSGGRRSQQ